MINVDIPKFNVIDLTVGEPPIFRTTEKNAYNSAINEGVIWLRPLKYFRDLEDPTRKDEDEHVLNFQMRTRIGLSYQENPPTYFDNVKAIWPKKHKQYILCLLCTQALR